MRESPGERLIKYCMPLALFAVAFVLCMQSPLDPVNKSGISDIDSSVFRYIGWAMTQGQVPYRDAFDHKGPLIYLFNYIGVLISGDYGIWWVELASMFFSVCWTYKLARRFGGRISSFLTVLLSFELLFTYFEGGNLSEEYALPFQIVALDIFVDFFCSPEKYLASGKRRAVVDLRVAVCGACFCAVVLLRANMIAVWAVFCPAIAIYCLAKRACGDMGRFILSFLLGAGLAFLPFAVYFLANNAFGEFIDDCFLFNFIYSGATSKRARIVCFKYFFMTSTFIFACAAMLIALLADKKRLGFHIAYAVFMVLTLALISMSGRTYHHYRMMLIPAIIYPTAWLLGRLEKLKLPGAAAQVLLAAALLATGWFIHPLNAAYDLKRALFDTPGGQEHAIPPEYEAVAEYIRANTEPDERITVFGNKAALYYCCQRLSVSRYFFLPYTATEKDEEIMDQYYADLEAYAPRYIVLAQDVARMNEFLAGHGYTLALDGEFPVYAKG